ncbi:MAG: isochorismatase family protein [Bdellovibrio sp.]|nr:isochorismatase family protein [Methylotenera sp.]
MPNKLLLQAAQSQLVVIDMQVKLAPAMDLAAMQVVTKNCAILLQTANLLQVATHVTEQYPHGLGETLPALTQYLSHAKIVAKTAFSACAEPLFKQYLQADKSQIVLTGMEAHICVLQTALDLLNMNKQVFVVQDAIISRNLSNKASAIARLQSAGCIITNTESVIFEWLGNANHEAFKIVSKLIKSA